MTVTGRVHVFVCRCGPNLGEHLAIDEIARSLADEPGVGAVSVAETLCSPEGRETMAARLSGSACDRVAVVACSPREHERTFMDVARQAGLNPHLVAMANVREQCAWVTPDRARATAKARALARAAIARVQRHEPLTSREIDCETAVAVIGSGLAGLTAAKTLADGDHRVVLVERDPCAGGTVALLGELYPGLECASCILDPLLDDVLHHPNVEFLALSEVEEVLGYRGRFTLRVRRRARHVDAAGCYGCGSCHQACPVETDSAFDAGLSRRRAIHIPYPGAVPHVSVVDVSTCRYFSDRSCRACEQACPFGNVRLDEPDEVLTRTVGAIVVASGCGARRVDRAPGPRVYSTYMAERLTNASGPTAGQVVMPDGSSPRSIALLHGLDRTGRGGPGRCSPVCCMTLAKHAIILRQKLPDAAIHELYWDRSVSGKGSGDLLRRHGEARIDEHRLGRDDRYTVRSHEHGVTIEIAGPGGSRSLPVDLAIAAPIFPDPGANEALARTLGIATGPDGFMLESHGRLRPFATRTEGILVAGTAQAPMDGAEAAAQGAAAAGQALAMLVPGRRLTLEPTTASVDSTVCSGCLTCTAVCPFGALAAAPRPEGTRVDETLCRGCGACAAACPSGAMTLRHSTDGQLRAELEALLRPDEPADPIDPKGDHL